ncbi:MAG: pyridoxal phosphate-dependent aminotransferase [Deltaproteobacteria bacterium]|nr:pyridoxal phosphate-dependent aminotransferase [Deltaproteobacteria bacterium]RLB90650.1 MAG: pyridoxal phosphate-dependent aminotransferase [Deltaproteobacteria bacterium]
MISSRTQEIKPFIVMDVLEKAQSMEGAGTHIVHLEIGEPDFNTPLCIKNAAIRALEAGHTHYTHSLGLRELREAICRHYHHRYGVTIESDQIIVTSGTSPAMFLLFSALLEPGDSVIISDPHYPCYPNFIRFAGGKPVTIPVYEDDGFQYRPETISEKIDNKTKAIVINSPSNPTGTLLSPDRIEAISKLSPYIISDEIYHGLVYEGKEHSILEYTDRAFVLNGFSKTYAMTGWRLGYLIAPKAFIRAIQKVQQNFFISASAIAQWAGIAALEDAGDDVARMRRTYDKRRQFLIRRLKKIGFGITVEPTGAFYVLANAKRFSSDSYKLAFDILDNAHVGVTPGVDFGENAEGYLRFSYANTLENIAEGMDRIEQYLGRISG